MIYKLHISVVINESSVKESFLRPTHNWECRGQCPLLGVRGYPSPPFYLAGRRPAHRITRIDILYLDPLLSGWLERSLSKGRAITVPLLFHPLKDQQQWLSRELDERRGALVTVTTARRRSAASFPARLRPGDRSRWLSQTRCASWR
jgi:hypothetical protein